MFSGEVESFERNSVGSPVGESSGARGRGSGNVLMRAPVSSCWIFWSIWVLSFPALEVFAGKKT
jgi:hypothetical protein